MIAAETSFRRWTAAALPTEDAIATLRAHPRFAEAFAAMAENVVGAYRSNKALSQVLNDRGRVVFGILALYLHFSGDQEGLTAGAMKALCRETELCSPGRATAMLSLMRFAGYIAPAEHALDRRIRLLVPTDRLIEDQKQRVRGEIAAVALLLPDGEAGLAQIDNREFLAEMSCCFGEAFRSGFRLLQYVPDLIPLADRNAGMIMLFSLLLARQPGDAVPPTRPVEISISELSKRCGVSRTHVLKFLRDCAAAGFIRIDAADSQKIGIQPSLADAMQDFVAALLLFHAYCIRISLARIQRQRSMTA